MSGSIGAQVVLDPASPASQGARGVAASTLYGNTVARDLGLISNGLDPLLTAGPPTFVVPFSLNFMRPGWLDPGVTFSRASTATYTDAAGVIQTATINAPRWDYANGVLLGLLIEEARTNLLLNSATLGTQGVIVTAQAYTLSFYGTGTITKSGAATGALVGTGATQRVSQTFTPTAGTVTCTVTGSVTNAQIEAGAFPTSYIPTTAAAVTRAIDVCGIPPANMGWFVSPGGSWMAEYISFTPAGAYPRIIGWPSASAAAPLHHDPVLHVSQYDSVTVLSVANVATLGVITKGASSYTSGAGKVCANGGAVVSGAMTNGYAGLSSQGVGFLTVGGVGSTDNTTGYIRRVRYWPRVLSDAELQAVTA